MRRNCLFLSLLLLLGSSSAWAGPRSYQQAKQIAERLAAKLGIVMDEQAGAEAKGLPDVSSSAAIEAVAYYVFSNGEDKGFTIVSGDDQMPEIVGYATQGNYDATQLPANYVGYMKAYQEMAEAVARGEDWALQCMAESKALRESGYQQKAVSPLLGDMKWNQSAPYNNMCPAYRDGKVSATGCVATAMAQVMAYHQYPKALKANIPAYVTNSYRLSIPGIGKGATYDWDNMLPTYVSGTYTQAQADAVAKLMYHCGAAVQMNYGPESSANVTPSRLSTYFGYDADLMQDISRVYFTQDQWCRIIDRELESKRPILYSGSSSSGGHAFVCDGADGNGYYHVNWGWGGYQDGYFDITTLNPAKGGIGSGSATDGYNRNCSMIIGIQPDNGKKDEPLVTFAPILTAYTKNMSFALTSSTRANVNSKFSGTIKKVYLANVSTEDFGGFVSLGIKQANGTYQRITNSMTLQLSGVLPNGATYYNFCDFNFSYAFPVGKTSLYFLYSDDGVNWKPCTYADYNPYVVEATTTQLSLVKSNLKAAVELQAGDEIVAGMDNTLLVTLTNDADYEYRGMLDIYSNSTNTLPTQASSNLYALIPAHTSIVRSIQIYPNTVGDLYLWMVDAKNGNTLVVNAERLTAKAPQKMDLAVVSISTNATPGDYETEQATYFGNQVKLPRVNDEKVVFTYGVRNNGGKGSITYAIFGYNGDTGAGQGKYVTEELMGHGAITYLAQEFTPSMIGSHSIMAQIKYFESDGWTALPSEVSSQKVERVNSSYSWNLGDNVRMVYVTGVASSIASVSADDASLYIIGGKGQVEVRSDKARTLPIYNIGGQKIAELHLGAGEMQTQSLPAGIYVIAGKKIAVR